MNKHLSAWKLIAESLQQQIPVMLLYVLESSGSSPGRQGFFMVVNVKNEPDSYRMEGSIGGGIMEHKFVEMAISSVEQNKNGTLKLSPNGIEFSELIPEENFRFSMRSEQDWEYSEKTGYKNELFIIGGGHCALAFSKLMSGMDFYIRVYDERKNLKTMLENKSAHEKHFINDYSELNSIIAEGNSHYAVIMTFGYRTDDIALRAIINKEFKYLGLLGSKSKIEKMFEDYRREGFEEKRLQRIHAPIGIPVKSQTPEEIAVSIAAEIIKIKNQAL